MTMEPVQIKPREQIAMVAVPLVEITHARGRPMFEELGAIDVLGNQCRIVTTGRYFEFWLGGRRFAISLEDLIATAGKALEERLRREIRDRVAAAQSAGTAPRDSGAALFEHHFGSGEDPPPAA